MTTTAKTKKNKLMTLKSTPGFLLKTYEMVDSPKYKDIISWSEKGDSFVVKNTKKMEEIILPEFFKHRNYMSFIR